MIKFVQFGNIYIVSFNHKKDSMATVEGEGSSYMDVMCRKYSCVYNNKAKCDRKNLSVDKNADCGDLKLDKTKLVPDVSRDMFEHEPDVAPFHHCKTMNISCKATDCIFNKEGECFSNGIFVGSEQTKAPCNSFVEK